MVEYEFSDLVTGEALPSDATYSAVRLVNEHRERWVFHTSVGDIVLRRMPLRMQRILQEARLTSHPSVQKLIAELDTLRPFIDNNPQADPRDLQRAMEIAHELMMSDLSPLGVVVVPEIRTMEEYDALLAMLTTEEQARLHNAVTELSITRPVSEVDDTPLVIAERLGIEVVPEDMIANLTVSQAAYFSEKISNEAKAIERMGRK